MREQMISALYEAPLADRPFAAVAPLLRRITNAGSIMFKFAPAGRADSGSIVADAEWDCQDSSDLYCRVYQRQDPVSYAAMAVGQFYRFEDLIGRDQLTRSDFYTQLCRPLNIDHAFFFYLGRHHGLDAWLNGARDTRRGAFSSEEAGRVRGLLPHLERSVRLFSRLAQQQARTLIYSESVAALGVGVLLLDRQGVIVDANEEAQRIVADGWALASEDGRLHWPGAGRHEASVLLDRVAGDGSGASQALTLHNGSGRRMRLVIRRTDSLIDGDSVNPPAFVVYLDREERQLPPRLAAIIAEQFDLTPVESRFALLLAEGSDLQACAERLGVTLTTARTYCKRVLAKTGTSRQAELVRLILGSLVRLS
jgi:DNA-binding CsgD family transcriptional regulator/PAS domain-containing protein